MYHVKLLFEMPEGKTPLRVPWGTLEDNGKWVCKRSVSGD